MTPDLEFYQKSENFKEWNRNTAFTVMGQVGYGSKINTPEGLLTAFTIPEGKYLGYGRIAIQFACQKTHNGKRYTDPLKAEVHENVQLLGKNKVLRSLVKMGNKKGATVMYSDNFTFYGHRTKDGEWYLIAERQISKNVDEKRRMPDGSWKVRSAIGLIHSFCNLFEDWTPSPLMPGNPNYHDPNSLYPLSSTV
jgi:hypothetical protein